MALPPWNGAQQAPSAGKQPPAKHQRTKQRDSAADGSHKAGDKHRRWSVPAGALSLVPTASQQSSYSTMALGTVALYTAIRGSLSLFHYTRRRYLRQLLLDLSVALTALNLTFWLDFGALLGIYRDKDLIPHDNDIDLAVLDVKDWPALLADLRRLLPQYSSRLVIPSEDPDARFIRLYCPFGMADVFGATPRGSDRLLVDCGHGSCTEIGRAAVLPTGVLNWRGHKLSVPGNVEAALEQRYGPTWRVPAYMDKGADTVEGGKLYARIFRALSYAGIRI